MKNYNLLLDTCKALAAYLHREDYDKQQRPYIDHCVRVSTRVPGEMFYAKEDETYFEYIDRVKEDPEALEVKLADLADNQDPLRGPIHDSPRDRYQKAEHKLLAEKVRRAS